MAAIEPRAVAPAIGPDGIPAAARRRAGSPRQVFAACAVGAAMLALLAPPDLSDWAERLGDGRLASVLREAASLWERDAERLGFTLPHHTLRRATQWLIERQWP